MPWFVLRHRMQSACKRNVCCIDHLRKNVYHHVSVCGLSALRFVSCLWVIPVASTQYSRHLHVKVKVKVVRFSRPPQPNTETRDQSQKRSNETKGLQWGSMRKIVKHFCARKLRCIHFHPTSTAFGQYFVGARVHPRYKHQ